MNEMSFIGRKGKGTQSSDQNTLRSRARVRTIELISEGPIHGLVSGSKSIYLDRTPIQNADGTFNFDNVTAQERKGYPDQAHFKGVNGVETTYGVAVEVGNSTGQVQRTIVDPTADSVRVIVTLNSLFIVDQGSGRLLKNSVSYRIKIRPIGGAWVTAVTKDITNQKCTSPVQFSHLIDLPDGGSPWDIAVERISADDPDDNHNSIINFDSYVVIVEGKYTYPNCAMVEIEADAESVGPSLPPRRVHVKGLLIDVPVNYNPITRNYTGVWNGTFKQAWTNNPAWIFYDLIINDRYGLGEFVNAAAVDKWSLYQIAQYCDQLVPSGFKDSFGAPIMEPRYVFNGVIRDRQKAYYVLQSMANAWRGMAYWAIGQVFASADMPSDPIKIVTPANVIGGVFNYSSSALKSRHSVAIVAWQNPDELYRQVPELVINDATLARFGWREKRVTLDGCTSRGQAHRFGKWILDVEENETETVEYTASWDHADLRPGDLIAIADPRKAQARAGGRIVSKVGNGVTLDAAFTPQVGQTYELMLTMPNGTIEIYPIASFAGDKVTLTSSGSSTADANAMYIIRSTSLEPRLYRVLSVRENEQGLFGVTALFHDPTKYARVEQGLNFKPITYTRDLILAAPPTGLTVNEQNFTANGRIQSQTTLSWTPPINTVVSQYIVTMNTPSQSNVPIATTTNTSIDIDDLAPGSYSFFVRTMNHRGNISSPASCIYTIGSSNNFIAPQVTSLALIENPGSNIFSGPDVAISWTNLFPISNNVALPAGAPNQSSSPLYKHNTVKVYNNDSNVLLRTSVVTKPDFFYGYQDNLSDCIAKGYTLPARNLRFEVTVTDITNKTSVAQTLTISNSVPAEIVPSISVIGKDLDISWPVIQDTDIVGIRIWVSKISGFDPNTTAPAFEGMGQIFRFLGESDTQYYIRISAYDVFGKTSSNISPEYSAQSKSLKEIFSDAGLTVPALVSTLPSPGPARFVGELVYLTTTNKLYRWDGAQWTAEVPTSDLTGRVASSQLMIADLSNLCEDPGFELMGAGWGAGGSNGFTIPAANALTGSRAAERAHAGAAGTFTFQNRMTFDARAGSSFRLSAYVKRSTDGVCTSAGVRISWLDESRALISNSDVVLAQASLMTSYQRVTGMLTAPVGSVYACVELVVVNQSAGSIFWDDVYCYRANGGELIVDGSVYGNHIAANTITGGLLAASGVITNTAQINDGLITTAKIGNLQVDTIKIADGAVTKQTTAYVGSSVTIPSTGAQTLLADGWIVANGAPVLLVFSALIDDTIPGGSMPLVLINVKCNGSLLSTNVNPFYMPNVPGFSLIDFPAAGNKHYEIFASTSAASVFAANRALFLMSAIK